MGNDCAFAGGGSSGARERLCSAVHTKNRDSVKVGNGRHHSVSRRRSILPGTLFQEDI